MASQATEDLRETLKAQSELLERLGSSALQVGSTLFKEGKDKLAVMTSQGSILLVEAGNHGPGELVYLLADTGQIWGNIKGVSMGDVASIHRIQDGNIYVNAHGQERLILAGQVSDLEPGDRVLLDPTRSVVLALVEKAPKPAFVPEPPKVCWGDIGGCSTAKEALIHAIETPYKKPALFKKYGRSPPKGVMFFGPPGCGKTMLAKAVATSINGSCGQGAFIAVKGPEILDPFVGVAEATVRDLFRQAREFKAAKGRPAVVFVDEAESILGHRGGRYNQMEKTIVPAFLAEMDGLEESGALVILCTNREDMLDPAVIRDGRIDVKLEIPRPSYEDAKEILGLYFKKAALCAALTSEYASKLAADMLYNEVPEDVKLPHSGAMLAGITNRATDNALKRDLRNDKFSGISAADVMKAVRDTYLQEARIAGYAEAEAA